MTLEMKNLPGFFVFAVCVSLDIVRGEAVLARLQALLDGSLDLKHMNIFWYPIVTIVKKTTRPVP